MNETPDEPGRPDQDRRGQQNDPTARDPRGGQPPPPDGDDDDEEEDEDEYQASSRRRILSGARLAAAGLAVVVLLGGGAALALNGGGGDGDDDTTSSSDDDGSSQEDAVFEFAQCMRDHGIEDFPDPQVDADGGISIGGSVADQRDTEEFKAADEACQHFLDDAAPAPEGQKLTPEEQAELQHQWRAVGQCVRDQGYDFADPEVDEYGGFKMRADGEGVESAIEECANEIGLGEPQGGEGGSSTGGEGGA